MNEFLKPTTIIDSDAAIIVAAAAEFAGDATDDEEVARRCFLWVRDCVRHSSDHRIPVVTCAASEVLKHRAGFCYAKSHLLAALLRARRALHGPVVAPVHDRRAVGGSVGGAGGIHSINAGGTIGPASGVRRLRITGCRAAAATPNQRQDHRGREPYLRCHERGYQPGSTGGQWGRAELPKCQVAATMAQ